MQNITNKTMEKGVDYFLDITAELCPLTFVRTKLLIEAMKTGTTAEIRLRGEEPLTNIPRAIAAQGHAVLELRLEDPAESAAESAYGVHRLRFRKN